MTDRIRPFRPFNDDFIELPLAIMDAPLFDSSRDIESAWHKCEEQIGKVEREGGILTILWHNNRFAEEEYFGSNESTKE